MNEIFSNTSDRQASDGERVAGIEMSPPLLRRCSWGFGLFLVVATLIAYQPVWHAGFFWDDDEVTKNLTLRSPGGLAQIWCNFTTTEQYYPLVFTSFWLEYHLWGLNPLGYHIINVLLHTLAAILLWRVLVRLQLPGAWLAAGIFALHPVVVESVAWVTERKNVLSAVFYFAAAMACLRWTEPGTDGQSQIRGSLRWYFLALVLFIAALLSKTTACSLPAAMLLVIWWKCGRIASRDVWPLAPFFMAGAALGWITSWLERIHVGAQGPEWAFSFPERCLIAGRALWFYAAKLFWPVNLTFIYPRWQINAGVWWQWIFPVAALAVVVALYCLRKRIGRGPLVAVLFFAGTLFPALGFANVYYMRYSFVADHFQYLASVGLIALAAAGLAKFWRPIPWTAVVLPLGLAILTWKQSHIYADEETLWKNTLTKNPACWMAHNNLGVALFNKGQNDEAISQYQEALRLKPDHVFAHNNLGVALFNEGRTDEAISQYREAIRLKPDIAEVHYLLGLALDKKGQFDEAISQYQEAIRLKPDIAGDHNNPNYTAALNNLAWNLATNPDAKIRNGALAVKLAERACELTHYQTTILIGTLAAAYAEAGRFDEAIATAEKACALATASGNQGLLKKNQELLALYRNHQPYHEMAKP